MFIGFQAPTKIFLLTTEFNKRMIFLLKCQVKNNNVHIEFFFLKFETILNQCIMSLIDHGLRFCFVTFSNKNNQWRAKGNLLGLQLLTIYCDFEFSFPWRRVTAQWILCGLNWMNEAKISDPKPICAHWCCFFFLVAFFSLHSSIHSYIYAFIHFFQSNKYSICIDNPLKIDRSLILAHTYG